ncbi:universal stress protein [Rhodococcus fascians]|nr:universal stress protein [Rhodococcus fascians]
MTGSRPIIVGIDGSAAADKAVIWAALCAHRRDRRLHIVTAVDMPGVVDLSEFAGEATEFVATAKSRLVAAETLAASVVDDPAFEVTSSAIEGGVMDVLIGVSAQAEILVIGASETGAVTLSLAAHSVSPVAVVRGRDIDGRPVAEGPVVVGIDGSDVNQAAVEGAFAEASARDTVLIAVHVWSDVDLTQSFGRAPKDWHAIAEGEEALLAESLAGWQERFPEVEVQRIVAQDRPVRVLSGLSETAALIVVGNRGRGGFGGMLLGSTSFALVNTADCPVLVVRKALT